ncbi:MAG: RNA polymerase sigma factor [Actinomycetota bacterium]
MANQGSATAWEEIVRRFERLVWAVARSSGLASVDAADAVQTTWLRLLEHLDRVESPDRLGSWLATTARRESIRVSQLRGRETVDITDEALARISDPGPSVEDALLSSERDATVAMALGRLDERCRRLLRVLAASPPPRYEAVAAAFGMPIGSIGPTRSRCLRHLANHLAMVGYITDLRLPSQSPDQTALPPGTDLEVRS